MPADEDGAGGRTPHREPLVACGVDRLLGAGLGHLAAQPRARTLPRLRPGDALRPVLVAGQLLQLAQVADRPARIELHAATLNRPERSVVSISRVGDRDRASPGAI